MECVARQKPTFQLHARKISHRHSPILSASSLSSPKTTITTTTTTTTKTATTIPTAALTTGIYITWGNQTCALITIVCRLPSEILDRQMTKKSKSSYANFQWHHFLPVLILLVINTHALVIFLCFVH